MNFKFISSFLNNRNITSRKSLILSFVLGAIIFGGIGVIASTYFSASQISFTPTNSEWTATNVEEAVNDLYDKAGADSFNNHYIAKDGQIFYDYELYNSNVTIKQNDDSFSINSNNGVIYNSWAMRILVDLTDYNWLVCTNYTQHANGRITIGIDAPISGGTHSIVNDIREYTGEHYLYISDSYGYGGSNLKSDPTSGYYNEIYSIYLSK